MSQTCEELEVIIKIIVMKTLFFFLSILLLPVFTIAQQLPLKNQSVREELLLKSKNQKTTGFLMLGLGAAATVGGAALFADNFAILGEGNDNAAAGGAILFVAGGLSMLGSIPFFIASSNNKQKAMVIKAGVKMEWIPRNSISVNINPQYPAVAVRVPL